MNNIEVPHLKQTALLEDSNKAVMFGLAVELLTKIQLDGETTEYLIDCLNQKEQLFKQYLGAELFGKSFEDAVIEINKYL